MSHTQSDTFAPAPPLLPVCLTALFFAAFGFLFDVSVAYFLSQLFGIRDTYFYYRPRQQLIVVCVYRVGCWVTAIVFPLVVKAPQLRIYQLPTEGKEDSLKEGWADSLV